MTKTPDRYDLIRAIMPILWKAEQYNGVGPDYDRYRINGAESMGGRVETYEARAGLIADAVASLFAAANTAQTAFQDRVGDWMIQCFGADITNNLQERCFRFSEEAGELVQSLGMTEEQWHDIGGYVWGRPAGEPSQEVGGVMVTLAAACQAAKLSMADDGETELARINHPAIMDKIRSKHAAKVLRTPLSALPGQVETPRSRLEDERERLMNSFGQSAFTDGQIRDRIAQIDTQLAGTAGGGA